jgi:hypothetical protein
MAWYEMTIGAQFTALSALLISLLCGCDQHGAAVADDKSLVPRNLSSLLALSDKQLAGVDIARLNLVCAERLPGEEPLDVEASLVALDAMAGRVQTETQRHAYRFQQNPADYEGSEGFFRIPPFWERATRVRRCGGWGGWKGEWRDVLLFSSPPA